MRGVDRHAYAGLPLRGAQRAALVVIEHHHVKSAQRAVQKLRDLGVVAAAHQCVVVEVVDGRRRREQGEAGAVEGGRLAERTTVDDGQAVVLLGRQARGAAAVGRIDQALGAAALGDEIGERGDDVAGGTGHGGYSCAGRLIVGANSFARSGTSSGMRGGTDGVRMNSHRRVV